MTTRFYLTYLLRELQRRRRQAVLTSVGLGVGVGLVVTVAATSAGMTTAEATILHSLYGIATDVTVTRAFVPPSHPTGTAYSPGSQAEHVDQLGLVPGVSPLDASLVQAITHLRDVAAVAGALQLTETQFTVPALSQLGPDGQPPKSAFPTTFTVDGLDVARPGLGPLASGEIISGRNLGRSDAVSRVAVVDAAYARSNGLTVGSTITIASTRFTIVGIVEQRQSGGAADVYIPLTAAQELAQFQGQSLRGKVDVIYVAAAGASNVAAVEAEIAKLLPSATVTGSADLAGRVSGSLQAAASLIDNLGRWLAAATMLAALAVAILLALGAVARRVREFGTLRALGWRSRRIVGQILGESLVVGAMGALIGIGLGFAGAALVTAVAPTLTATVAQNPGSTPPRDTTVNGSGMHHPLPVGSVHTVVVHLTAQVTPSAIALAVLLSIAGTLLAGSFGAWRAASLRPAAALADVG